MKTSDPNKKTARVGILTNPNAHCDILVTVEELNLGDVIETADGPFLLIVAHSTDEEYRSQTGWTRQMLSSAGLCQALPEQWRFYKFTTD